MDLITLGMTVDSLYRIFHTMDARQCMETLANYGEYSIHVDHDIYDSYRPCIKYIYIHVCIRTVYMYVYVFRTDSQPCPLRNRVPVM